jgi:hypothetical protein
MSVPPPIPEFTVWEDADGFHATWMRPLSDAEKAASLPGQVDAALFEELQATCSWERIRRDVTTSTRWRTAEAPFLAGDPT